MSIKKVTGTIIESIDLSPTAKDITITLPADLNFIAGSFVNIFMDIEGKSVRRAFSISSTDTIQNKISLSIRLSKNGTLSPLFWQKEMLGKKIEIMGPLGLNTADTMKSKKIFLFGFGIGAGVVKSLLDHFANKEDISEIVIATGSRSEDEILHKEYFDTMAKCNPKIAVHYSISKPIQKNTLTTGYIQDHIADMDFNNADVYMCGQEIACTSLVTKIKEKKPTNCNFFIEAFH